MDETVDTKAIREEVRKKANLERMRKYLSKPEWRKYRTEWAAKSRVGATAFTARGLILKSGKIEVGAVVIRKWKKKRISSYTKMVGGI